MIGETFFFNNHIDKKVINKAAKPGINWFKLSCNVVTLYWSNERPAFCSTKAFLTPAAPDGSCDQLKKP